MNNLLNKTNFVLVLVTVFAALSSGFVSAQSDDAAPQAAGCGDQYDHSIALNFGNEYRKALKAKDYARLKELKAQKDQTNLWSKTSKSCVKGSDEGEVDNNANSNDVECERLNTALDNALASQCAYNGEQASCKEAGYEVINPADIGLDPSLFHLDGFHAEILIKDGVYTVSFRGTGGEGFRDLLDDIQDDIGQSQGFTTSQYVLAADLARELDIALGSENINFTGHSLGGGLATVAALTIQRPAIVYNPAGLHPDVAEDLELEINSADNLVTNYYVEGEIVTSAQDLDPIYIPNLDPPFIPPYFRLDGPPAPGVRQPLAPPSDEWWDENQSGLPDIVEKPITYHYISTVIVSIREELDENDCLQ